MAVSFATDTDPRMLRIARWSLVFGAVGVIGVLFGFVVDWDDFVEEIGGNGEDAQLVDDARRTSPEPISSPSTTTTAAASTTTSGVASAEAVVSLHAMGPDDLAQATSDLIATFRFIHSDLCLTSHRTGNVTQETCEREPAKSSNQLWQISVGTETTQLEQDGQCLVVLGDTEELDPMGNTLGELGLDSCEAVSSGWRLGYVDNRAAFAVLTADRSRCLDVLGGKEWSGQPVVAYPCISDFDNQFVTVQAGSISP